MKTLKLIAPLLFMLTLIYSCTTEEYYTTDPVDGGALFYAQDVTISNWTLKGGADNIGSYFESVVYIKQLDTQYYNDDFAPYYDGVITVGMYINKQNKEVQVPLPYTIYDAYKDDNGNWVYYSLQFSYDVEENGNVSFKAYFSDYLTQDVEIGTQYFRVAAVW